MESFGSFISIQNEKVEQIVCDTVIKDANIWVLFNLNVQMYWKWQEKVICFYNFVSEGWVWVWRLGAILYGNEEEGDNILLESLLMIF